MAVLTFRYSAQRHGQDAIDSARYWLGEAHKELCRPPQAGRQPPLTICVNRSLHAVDALMMALGVSERPA